MVCSLEGLVSHTPGFAFVVFLHNDNDREKLMMFCKTQKNFIDKCF